MQDIWIQRNCRRKRYAAGKNDDDYVSEDIGNVSTTESDDGYSYNYDTDENDYYYLNTELEDCNNLGKFNGSAFEENQRNISKELPRNIYCDLIGTLETQCFEQSILLKIM